VREGEINSSYVRVLIPDQVATCIRKRPSFLNPWPDIRELVAG
jgi:hypothetical protein